MYAKRSPIFGASSPGKNHSSITPTPAGPALLRGSGILDDLQVIDAAVELRLRSSETSSGSFFFQREMLVLLTPTACAAFVSEKPWRRI